MFKIYAGKREEDFFFQKKRHPQSEFYAYAKSMFKINSLDTISLFESIEMTHKAFTSEGVCMTKMKTNSIYSAIDRYNYWNMAFILFFFFFFIIVKKEKLNTKEQIDQI